MADAPTFYIFHGEDEYNIAARIQAMRNQMLDNLNISEFDGTKATVGEVLSSVRVLPFLADKRLVIVRGMLKHITRKGAGKVGKADLNQLIETLPTLPKSARLVFWENKELNAKNKLVLLANTEKSGYIKSFTVTKNINSWLAQKAQEYGVDIQPAAANALSNVVGKDLRAADGEIFKLAAYVGVGEMITAQDVALLTSYVAEADIFAMVDAIGQRNGRLALHHLKQLLVDGQPLQLFAMIVRQFRFILLAREWMDNGGGVSELASAIGVHPFVAKKVAAQAKGYRNIREIEEIYRELLATDVGIKTGKIKDQLGLEVLIASLAKGD